MTDFQEKFMVSFSAWLVRRKLSDLQAADRLSRYRKVTAEQVGKMRRGEICPSVATCRAWVDEVNSSDDVFGSMPDSFKDIFKEIFG